MEDRLTFGVKPSPTGEEKTFEGRGEGACWDLKSNLRKTKKGKGLWREGENGNETTITNKNLVIKIAYAV